MEVQSYRDRAASHAQVGLDCFPTIDFAQNAEAHLG